MDRMEQEHNDAALAEAASMLAGMAFDSVGGGVARGDSVLISVVPSWDDPERSKFTARLLCQATWHRKVDWSSLRVFAKPATGENVVMHLHPLTADGRATFENLDPGTYQLKAYLDKVQFKGQAPQGLPRAAGFGLRSAPVRGVHSPDATQAPDTADTAGTGIIVREKSKSADISVLIGQEGSNVTIQFATDSEDLEGKSIEFCITDPTSGRVLKDGLTAALSESAAGEYRYLSNVTELPFDAGVEYEISYLVC